MQQITDVSIPFQRERVSKDKEWVDSVLPSYTVSIPFQRESVSKVQSAKDENVKAEFPFPSNGKAYPKLDHLFYV